MSNDQSWDSGAGFILIAFGIALGMFFIFIVSWFSTAGDVMVIDGQYYVHVGKSVGSNSNNDGDWFEFDPEQPVTFVKVANK